MKVFTTTTRALAGAGLCYELDDGRLIRSYQDVAPSYVGRIDISSDGGATWANHALTATASIGRNIFRAANGSIFLCTTSSSSRGRVFRSADGGETWAQVLQAATLTADAIWGFCENSSGELFCAEYGDGTAVDTANKVYKSTDDGVTWAEWLVVPRVRHIHGVYCDSQDRMFLACGEFYTRQIEGVSASWSGGTATYACGTHDIEAGEWMRQYGFSNSAYDKNGVVAGVVANTSYSIAMAADPGGTATGGTANPQYANGNVRVLTDNGASGAIGDIVATVGNGWLKMLESANGDLFFGFDERTGSVACVPSNSLLWCDQARIWDRLPGAQWGSFGFDGCIGRDGVLYFLVVRGINTSCLYASHDDGITWVVIDCGLGVAYGANNLTCNALGPSDEIYISGNDGNPIRAVKDFTRSELRKRRSA